MSELYYEFWRHDTFENRTFLIKVFENKEKAEKVLAKAKRDTLSPGEKVRYNFWLIEKTSDEIREEERLKEEQMMRIIKEWCYDDNQLRDYVSLLADRLMDIIEQDRQGLIWEQNILLQENNVQESNWYTSIALQYIKSESESSVSTEIRFRNGDCIERRNVISDPVKQLIFFDYDRILIESFKKDIVEAIYKDESKR